MGKLVCDICKVEYKDEESIEMAKSFQEHWEASCSRDGREPRGIAPCPIFSCSGELALKEE